MTREEAIDYNKNLRMYMKLSDKNQPCKFLKENYIALDMAIKALEPVTPQPKMGQWIEHFDESGKWYECDQCHTDWGGPVNYCPNCGAKM